MGGFQLEFVSISRVMNHMTHYEFKSSHSGKFILKNPLQHLLSSRNAVISTNESTQIYDTSYDLQPGLYLQIPTENHQCQLILKCLFYLALEFSNS